MSKNGFRHFRNWDAPVTSAFGYRGAVYKDGKLLVGAGGHNGVDYGTDCKKIPVYALEDGIVRTIWIDGNGAKTVYVEYPRLGHIGWYCHFDEIRVSKGQAVNKDTILGITGMTGLATGVHLHFSWFPTDDYGKWNNERYEDFEQYEYPKIVVPEPVQPVVEPLKVGDRVKIIATGNGSSIGTSNTAYGIGWERQILKVWNGRLYPYQVGNSTGTTGFYKAEALQKI